jgi:hypothetical protein
MASTVDDFASLSSRASDPLARLESAAGALVGGLLDASTRLYRLEGSGALDGLQVEAFVIEDALSQPWRMELVALHEDATLDLDAMLAQPRRWSPCWPTAPNIVAAAWCCRPRPRTATADSRAIG